MKFGIIKERNTIPDKRVVFSPDELARIMQLHQEVSVKVESSEIRIFTDQEYKDKGIEVANDISDADVFFGINEVPVEILMPNKSYFFFLHPIKKQPQSRVLLQTLLEKNINFYDFEAIVDAHNSSLVGFEKFAGMLGVYNTIRGFGIKFELFKLPNSEVLSGKEELIAHLKRLVLPPIKIVITGTGNMGSGVKEIVDAIKIKEVSVENYLTKNYTQPVYVQIDVLDYNSRKDGQVIDSTDFFQNPQEYVSNFERFTKVSDLYIKGHFHVNEAPNCITREMLQAKDFKIKVVGDISWEESDSIACSVRKSTLANPFYGYLPSENKEVDIFHPAAIVVMAVGNLSSELPRKSSKGFGEMFLEQVIPAFFNGDKDGILERAKITEKGKLTPKFSYLQDYVDGKE